MNDNVLEILRTIRASEDFLKSNWQDEIATQYYQWIDERCERIEKLAVAWQEINVAADEILKACNSVFDDADGTNVYVRTRSYDGPVNEDSFGGRTR